MTRCSAMNLAAAVTSSGGVEYLIETHYTPRTCHCRSQSHVEYPLKAKCLHPVSACLLHCLLCYKSEVGEHGLAVLARLLDV